MPKFSVQEGEEIIDRAAVHTAAEGVVRPAKLVLTNQRVVLIPDEKPSRWLPAGLAKLLAKTTDKISHQIRRAEFGSVEATGPNSIKVRSRGEGYGMTWFEIEGVKSRDAWMDALTRWGTHA